MGQIFKSAPFSFLIFVSAEFFIKYVSLICLLNTLTSISAPIQITPTCVCGIAGTVHIKELK